MALKMKDLVALSGESKSTILYYVKEGLLPEPQKPKPNVHLYDESCVERIRLIKYLQEHFGYTIADIKHIFANNRFDFDGDFDTIIRSLEMIGGGRRTEWYDKAHFLEKSGIDEATLDAYLKAGYLFEHPEGFGKQELEIVKILQKAKYLGLDFSLIDAYVKSARNLAAKENEIGAKLLEDDTTPHNERYALLFDLILTLKPYLFNQHTIEAHHHNIAKDAQ